VHVDIGGLERLPTLTAGGEAKRRRRLHLGEERDRTVDEDRARSLAVNRITRALTVIGRATPQ